MTQLNELVTVHSEESWANMHTALGDLETKLDRQNNKSTLKHLTIILDRVETSSRYLLTV